MVQAMVPATIRAPSIGSISHTASMIGIEIEIMRFIPGTTAARSQ
jgi:hypothetical protein